MTSQEYTQWLKGFLDAVDNYSITKKQFDSIREKLKEVDDTTHNIGVPIGTPGTPYWGGWGTTTPYSIPLSGTITTGGTITTSNYPSGSTVTYTTGNGGISTYTTANSGTAIVTNGIITSTSAYVNQSEDGDEKLLLD
jgi:hypothetical protein